MIVVMLAGYLGFLHVPYVTPPSRAPPVTFPELYYPVSVGSGVTVGNYLAVGLIIISNSTVQENTPVEIEASGCMTATYAANLTAVVVDYPQAEPLSGFGGHLLNGTQAYGVILHPEAEAPVYCPYYYGKMSYLVGNSTLLKWQNSGSYSPVMTLQYSNGTKLYHAYDSPIVVQSGLNVIATKATEDAVPIAFTAIIIGLIERLAKITGKDD